MLQRTRRALAGLGLASPFVYVSAVVIGQLLWPGYSGYAESVSTLTSSGAPNQWLLVPLFGAYNVGLIALATAIPPADHSRRWGSVCLASAGLDGLLLFAFPQDPWGAPISSTGSAHIAIAGGGVACLLAAMALLGRSYVRDPRNLGIGRLTLGLLGVGLIAGGVGAAAVRTPFAGLAERVSIGVFLVWVTALAARLLTEPDPEPGQRVSSGATPTPGA